MRLDFNANARVADDGGGETGLDGDFCVQEQMVSDISKIHIGKPGNLCYEQ